MFYIVLRLLAVSTRKIMSRDLARIWIVGCPKWTLEETGWPGERPPLTAGGLGPAGGPQKPEGLGALKCILWLFLALIFIILHIEMYVFSVWIIHFIDIFPGMSNLNNFSIAIQVNLDMTDHCTTDFCIRRTICLVPVRCITSICHMYTTDFAYDGPIFLVPLSPSYPSSPVLHTRMTRKQAPTLISRSWNSLSRSILSLARRKENLHNYL